MEHQSCKGFYAHTNKKNYVVQVAKLQHRQQVLGYIKKRIVGAHVSPSRVHPRATRRSMRRAAEQDEEVLPSTMADLPYTIASSTRNFVDIDEYCMDNEDDPAARVCHILAISGSMFSDIFLCRILRMISTTTYSAVFFHMTSMGLKASHLPSAMA